MQISIGKVEIEKSYAEREGIDVRVHITNLYGMAPFSTALIAQNDSAKIGKKLGYNELGVYAYDSSRESGDALLARLDGIIASVGLGDIVIYQSPTWNGHEFDRRLIDRLKATQCKLISFIHDIPPFMFWETNGYLTPYYIDLYNQSDLLILPSKRIHDRMIAAGLTVKKVVYQEFWDHPYEGYLNQPVFQRKLYFAGNVERFPHLANWNHSTPLFIFSKEKEGAAPGEFNRFYEGWKPDSLLMNELSGGGFGLVWGTSEKPEDEEDYYTQNLSHKVSTYLAAGIPIVVPSYLSNAAYIEDNGLGFVVSSLEEANQRIEEVTEEVYQTMIEKVKYHGFLLRNGYFTQKVLSEAVVSLGQQTRSDLN